MANLKYAVLNVCQWYSPSLRVNEVTFVPGKLDDTIAHFTSTYCSCFSSRYASKSYHVPLVYMLEHMHAGSLVPRLYRGSFGLLAILGYL